MIGRDLTLPVGEGCFNYRVGAIIIRAGKLLTVFNGSYYYTVGGRVKFGETAGEAIVREIREELRADAEIDYPAYFHELFYEDRERDGRPTHEIALFYVMKPFPIPPETEFSEPDAPMNPPRRQAEEDGERLVWLPLAELERYEVYPAFFAERLKNPKREFVVVTERQ